jgi:hypothetical protein
MKLLYFTVLILFCPIKRPSAANFEVCFITVVCSVYVSFCMVYYLTSIAVVPVTEEEMARNLNFCNRFGYTIFSHCLHVVLVGVYWN